MEESASGPSPQTGAPTVEQIREALTRVQDPELGIDIVALGLIYGIEIVEGKAKITMTLTGPGCPVGPLLQAQAHAECLKIPGITGVDINLVWQPAWDPYKMASEDARIHLGIF